MNADELELALSKLRDTWTEAGRERERETLRRLLREVTPEEADAKIRPRLLALGSEEPEEWLTYAQEQLDRAAREQDWNALWVGLACLDEAKWLAQGHAPDLLLTMEAAEQRLAAQFLPTAAPSSQTDSWRYIPPDPGGSERGTPGEAELRAELRLRLAVLNGDETELAGSDAWWRSRPYLTRWLLAEALIRRGVAVGRAWLETLAREITEPARAAEPSSHPQPSTLHPPPFSPSCKLTVGATFSPRHPLTLPLASAWDDHLRAVAAPIRAFFHEKAARARGKDWPEQDWDNYCYDLQEVREWQVAVPFECLRLAQEPTVPLTAARRILGLSADLNASATERGERSYHWYWRYNKRFLALCAELGARFLNAGGLTVAAEVLRRLDRLPPGDENAVRLRCATLGLTGEDPHRLAQELLRRAARDELGSRGEWVIVAVDNAAALPAARSQEVLRAATFVARQTTALVASNPYAVCLEALSEGADPHSLPTLVEVLARARTVRGLGWRGWQRTLTVCADSLRRLVAAGGEETFREAFALLPPLTDRWPEAGGRMALAAAEGLAAVDPDLHAQALETAAALIFETREPRLWIETCGQLMRLGQGHRVQTIRAVVQAARRRERDALRAEAAMTLAEVSAAGLGEWLDEALAWAQAIGRPLPRWMALMAGAEALLRQGDGRAEEVFQAARADEQRLAGTTVPHGVLIAAVERLAEAGEPLLNDALPELIRLTRAVYRERLYGRNVAEGLMGLAAHATDLETVAAFCDLALDLRGSWWSLAFLSLADDSLAAAMQRQTQALQRRQAAARWEELRRRLESAMEAWVGEGSGLPR